MIRRSSIRCARWFALMACGALAAFAAPARAVTISETEYEGRPQFKVETKSATYYYDRAGGGFSRLLDRDGRDWIFFKKEPLSGGRAPAAAGFRGIPNLVFGKDNPDAGAGHPGHDRCASNLVAPHQIRTVSKSGRWAWSWHFTEDNATLTIEHADPDHAYWFLYEGTVGGRWSPGTHYFGTDRGGPRRDTPFGRTKLYEPWRWAYFGDESTPRALLAVQVTADNLDDTLWYMGNTDAELDSDDGMIVFGFGRGKDGPLLRGAGQRFVIGLVESDPQNAANHQRIARAAEGWLHSSEKAVGANGPLRIHPTNPRYFTDGSTNPDGSPRAVYLAGSHVWHSFQDHGHRLESGAEPPPEFDYLAFLNRLQANGHNFTRLWRWELPRWTEGDTKTKQTENSQPHPWPRSGPGLANDGKVKFDLSRFDESYFERLRTRVKLAGERGIHVSVMLFECWGVQHVTNAWQYHPLAGPNNVNGIEADEDHDGWGREVHTLPSTVMGRRVLAIQEAYVRKVLSTLADQDNVLYEITNEGGTYSAAWQNHIVDFIHREEADRPKQHLVGITFLFSKNRQWRGDNAMLFQSRADWVSPGNEPATSFGKNPPLEFQGRIVVADTDHLGWNAHRDHDWFWKQFCRGNHVWYLEWAYDSPTEAVAAREAMGQTVRWSRRVNLAEMEPSTNLASTAWCLVNPGKEYLVYQPAEGGFTVDLRNASGDFSVEWFSPKFGASRMGNSVRGGAIESFTSPHKGSAVLHLKVKE